MTALSVTSMTRFSAGRPGFGQDLRDHGRELAGELLGRHVDAEHEVVGDGAVTTPRDDLTAGLLEDRPADLEDEVRVLGDLDEDQGRDRAMGRVLPARQRLDGAGKSGGEGVDRLVGDALVSSVSMADPEVGLEVEPCRAPRCASRARTGPSPPRRRALARYIAASASRSRSFGEAVSSPATAMPMLPRPADLAALDLDGRAQEAEQAVRGRDGHVGGDILEQDREFVAAETGDAVAGPDGAAQALADDLEQRVAGGVPEAVVDGLELVEVEEEAPRDRAPDRLLRASDCASRSANKARLARPVSGSWNARRPSCCSSALRSVMSTRKPCDRTCPRSAAGACASPRGAR